MSNLTQYLFTVLYTERDSISFLQLNTIKIVFCSAQSRISFIFGCVLNFYLLSFQFLFNQKILSALGLITGTGGPLTNAATENSPRKVELMFEEEKNAFFKHFGSIEYTYFINCLYPGPLFQWESLLPGP